jgi:hypothetical protein
MDRFAYRVGLDGIFRVLDAKSPGIGNPAAVVQLA